MSASIRMPKLLAVLIVAALAVFAAVVPASSAHAAATYSISGKVTLPAGAPSSWMQGVSVLVSNDTAYGSVQVDPSTGVYSLAGLAAGTYKVRFLATEFWDDGSGGVVVPNLISEFYNDSLSASGATSVTVGPSNATGINATLAQGKTISGTVTVPAGTSMQLLNGVTVWASCESLAYFTTAYVDETNGSYTLAGLPSCAYVLSFEPGDYYDGVSGKFLPSNLVSEFYNNSGTFAGATKVTVGSSNVSGINVALATGPSISGKVTLPAGAPSAWYEGIIVYAFNGEFERYGVVDPATGNYSVTGLGAGKYTVEFYVGSYYSSGTGTYVTPNLKTEYYNNASTSSAGTKVTIAGSNVTGINASMDYKTVSSFTSTPAPTITGTPAVGSKLGVSLGTWSPKPDSMTYQWYRDGVAISGAKYYQYTVVSADAGHQLSVAVTAVKAGYASVAKSSTRVSVPLQTFSATGTPTVTGTLAVGSKVTANPGTWTPTPGAFTYQWYRDGVAISGAAASQYTLAGADAGHQVSVGVTGQKTGFKSVTKASARASVPYSTFTTAPTPTITGTLAAGNKVTANVGSWAPKPDTVKYQWYRDGVAISGAVYYQYTLTATDKGRQISVAVTASKAGYKSVVKASARVSVAP